MKPRSGSFALLFPPPLLGLIGAAVLLFIGVYQRALAPLPEPRSTSAGAAASALWAKPSYEEVPAPRHAHVAVSTDRRRYFLGEDPSLRLTVTNHGRAPLPIRFGSDYRGSTRALRFLVSARDARGAAVPDPFPPNLQRWMGGMGGMPSMLPGESHSLETPLMRHADIRRPGVYHVDVRHDLGWRPQPGASLPGGSVIVELVEPTEAEAREILRRASPDEFTNLRFPIYLPLLAAEAATGRAEAITGIGHIRGAEATACLIRLAQPTSPSAEVRRRALEFLIGRVPGGGCRHLVVAGPLLAAESWDDATRHDALALGRALLVEDKEAETTALATEIVALFGDEQDVPPLLRLLEANLTPPTDLDGESMHAREHRVSAASGALLRLRSWTPDAMAKGAPSSSAERYMLLLAAWRAEAPDSPPAIEDLAVEGLAHPSPWIARMAFHVVRHPVPTERLPIIRDALVSENWMQRSAALDLLRRTRDTRLREELFTLLAHDRDSRLLGTVTGTALTIFGADALFPRLIARLTDPDMDFALRVHDELLRLVFEDRGRRYLNPAPSTADFERLRAAWEMFFAEQRHRLARGRKLSPTARGIPAELFAGRFMFEDKSNHRSSPPVWMKQMME